MAFNCEIRQKRCRQIQTERDSITPVNNYGSSYIHQSLCIKYAENNSRKTAAIKHKITAFTYI